MATQVLLELAVLADTRALAAGVEYQDLVGTQVLLELAVLAVTRALAAGVE